MGSKEASNGAGVHSTVRDDAELLSLLKLSVQEVFSSMVWTFCEAVVHEVGEERALVIESESGTYERVTVDTEACVDFEGELGGSVVLRCAAAGAMDIARGLLMMDEGEALEIEEVSDALGECANMVAGGLKTRGLDPHGEFRISVPHVTEPGQNRSGNRSGTLVYRLTQGLISVEIWIDD